MGCFLLWISGSEQLDQLLTRTWLAITFTVCSKFNPFLSKAELFTSLAYLFNYSAHSYFVSTVNEFPCGPQSSYSFLETPFHLLLKYGYIHCQYRNWLGQGIRVFSPWDFPSGGRQLNQLLLKAACGTQYWTILDKYSKLLKRSGRPFSKGGCM